MTARGKLIRMMNLEEQLNLARRKFQEGGVSWFDDLAIAVLMAAGGRPSILNSRQAIREALKEDPEWRRTYVATIACKLMDFENMRHAEPGKIVGPMTANERNQLAEQILSLIFSE